MSESMVHVYRSIYLRLGDEQGQDQCGLDGHGELIQE